MIRKASIKDCEAFLLLRQQSILALAKGHYTPEQLDDWAYHSNQQKIRALFEQGHFFVGECESGIIAGGGSWYDDYLGHLYVDPYYSGKGWGEKLLTYLEQEYRKNTGHDYIQAEASFNARPFYESQGYIFVETGITKNNGIASGYDLMRKTFPDR